MRLLQKGGRTIRSILTFVLLQLNSREINILDQNTKTYESVGRMFLFTPVDKVKVNLKTKQNNAEEKIKLLENNKTYLENSLKEATNSLRELVQAKK